MFLVIMAGVHVPSPVSRALREPFGFASAAEGFIFLSACLAGFVYGKTYLKSGWSNMSQKVWNRARLVYLVHVALLLPAALAAWIHGRQVVPLANHFHDFLVHPWGSLSLLPLLLHQPPLFDILPMYVLLLLATPLAFAFARRFGWSLVLMFSAIVWLAGQFQSSHFSTDTVRLLPLRGGAFNLLAWQFLWMTGLALGEVSIHRPAIPPRFRLRLGGLAVMVVFIGLCARHGIVAGWQLDPNLSLTNVWLNKWSLGPLRLLNFAGWVVLLLVWNPRPPGRWLAPTALLGRHSLAVFAFHLPMVITASAVIQMLALNETAQTLLALVVIASLFAWAWWLENNARNRAIFTAGLPSAVQQSSRSEQLPCEALVATRARIEPPLNAA